MPDTMQVDIYDVGNDGRRTIHLRNVDLREALGDVAADECPRLMAELQREGAAVFYGGGAAPLFEFRRATEQSR